MKHRNIMAVIFLSIITLGIYDLFWLVRTKKVLNQSTKHHVPSIWIMFAPVVVFVAAAIAAGVHAAMSSSSHVTTFDGTTTTTSTNAGFSVAIIGLDVLALVVLVPLTFYWFFKFSKAVNEYTNGEINTAVSFLLLYLLRFIGIAVIQDKFNEMGDAGGSTLSQPVAPQTPPASPAPTPPVAASSPIQADVAPTPAPAEPGMVQPQPPTALQPEPVSAAQPVPEQALPPEQPTPPQNPTIVQG